MKVKLVAVKIFVEIPCLSWIKSPVLTEIAGRYTVRGQVKSSLQRTLVRGGVGLRKEPYLRTPHKLKLV